MQFHHASEQTPTQLYDVVATLQPWVHDASRPYADWYFGDEESAAELIRRWMQRPTSEVYVGRAMLMMDHLERPIGCVIGMDGAELARCRAADFGEFCEAIGELPDAAEIAEQTVAVSRELFAPVDDDEFYISRVALSRHCRGRGLGRAMVQRAIEAQAERGVTRFRLDVSCDNAAAIRAYEAVGLREVRRARAPAAGLEYCAMTLEL
jgi:ribosomal protein S18 acetylase RimI-like enzyme